MISSVLRKICPNSGEKCDCPKGICQHSLEATSDAMDTQYSSVANKTFILLDDIRSSVVQTLECPVCKSKGFPKSKMPNRCEFCDGTFSGNPPSADEIAEAQGLCQDEGCPQSVTPHVCVTPDERSRMDQQEAASLKYSLCTQILPLSSGKFALFGPYSIQDGIPLITIDTWAALEPHVRAYKELADTAYRKGQERTLPAKTTTDYDNLFGEDTPDAE